MSPLQYKIYKYIRDYIQIHGYSPSFKEITEGVGISPNSKGLISRYVKILVNAGWLQVDHKGYRSVQVPTTPLRLPIIGRISAGSPIEPVEQQEILDISAALWEEGCFVLEVKGDSMNGEGIFEGDYIICKKQSKAEDGEIAVVMIDQEKATLKRIYYQEDGRVLLEAANPRFKPQIYTKEQITIQGVFIGLVRLPKKTPKEPPSPERC